MRGRVPRSTVRLATLAQPRWGVQPHRPARRRRTAFVGKPQGKWSVACSSGVPPMKYGRPIRRVVAEQLDGRHGVDLIAIAHAFEEEFGVEFAPEQLRRVGTYGDLLQLLTDELAGGTESPNDDEISSCFVRARVVTGGPDCRVLLVRVGWLT